MSELTGETVEFGTGENRTIGIIQSENDNNSAEVAEIRDETGKIVLQKAYSKSNEKTFEAIFMVGVTPPAAGTALTIGSGETAWTGIVTASNITKSNTEFTKVSITAQKKDSATVVAYA
ncbi:MAG: hypothetical protein BWY31_03811 [Lentisphaerae bacterium ADurb.Bin242]|nr:MAG: hypothetical protein BWY31_03811 [Lentisphaerae bacterium ADurb.Bin242]